MDERKEYVHISLSSKLAPKAQHFREGDGARLPVHQSLSRKVYPRPNTNSLQGILPKCLTVSSSSRSLGELKSKLQSSSAPFGCSNFFKLPILQYLS